MDSDQQNIVDGEIVDGSSATSSANKANDSAGAVGTPADDLITITNLIQSYIATIDKSQKELQAHKQMLQDAFLNDPTYREHDQKVKDAVKVRNTTKQQILKQPTLQEQAQKIKEMAESLKESRESLSDYLQEYARISGMREIADLEGEIREIVYVAKLIKGATKKK